jgi:DNA invertase Pin-like site-specific DNA recombinase
VENGMSLDAQRGRIEAWCRAADATLLDVVVDAGVSGSRRLEDRPGGIQVAQLFRQRQPEVDAVAVVRLDRLGRDAAETLELLKRFASGKVGLISIVDRLDLTSPQGRAMAGVSAVFAQLERELIAQRTAEALGELRNQRRVYGPIPFGYDGVDGELIENAAEQVVLDFMQAMRRVGMSFARIAHQLNAEGHLSKTGGRWHAMSVRSVLKTSERLQGAELQEAVA